MSPSSVDTAPVKRACNLGKLLQRWMSLLASPEESDRLLGIKLISRKVSTEIKAGRMLTEEKVQKEEEKEKQQDDDDTVSYLRSVTNEIKIKTGKMLTEETEYDTAVEDLLKVVFVKGFLFVAFNQFTRFILLVEPAVAKEMGEERGSLAVAIEALRGLRSILDAATERRRLLEIKEWREFLGSALQTVLAGSIKCSLVEGEEDKVDALTCEAFQVIASHAGMLTHHPLAAASSSSSSSDHADYFGELLPHQLSKATCNNGNNNSETVRTYALFSLGWTLPFLLGGGRGHLDRDQVELLLPALAEIALEDPCPRNKEFSLVVLMEVLGNCKQEDVVDGKGLYSSVQKIMMKCLKEKLQGMTVNYDRVFERSLAVLCVLSIYTRDVSPVSELVPLFIDDLPLKEVTCWNLHIFHALFHCDPNDLKDRPQLVLEVAASAYANNWRAKMSVEQFLTHSRKHFKRDYRRTVVHLKKEDRAVISDAEKGLGKSGPFPCGCCQEWAI